MEGYGELVSGASGGRGGEGRGPGVAGRMKRSLDFKAVFIADESVVAPKFFSNLVE